VLALAAMPEELAPLCRLARDRRGLRADGRSLLRARLGAATLLIARTGEGPALARQTAESLLESFSPGLLLSLGVAGGLSPELEPGDLVVARSVLGGGGEAAGPDPAWLDRALSRPGVIAGTLLSTERILRSAESKRRARASIVESGAAVVDLEAATLAEAAARRGVPFLAARAVSDGAQEDLPLDFESCRDEEGRIRRWKVVGRALAHPRSISRLAELRRRVAEGAERLAAFTAGLLEETEGGSS
jgi:adenosylhomocysteine nucleosidase